MFSKEKNDSITNTQQDYSRNSFGLWDRTVLYSISWVKHSTFLSLSVLTSKLSCKTWLWRELLWTNIQGRNMKIIKGYKHFKQSEEIFSVQITLHWKFMALRSATSHQVKPQVLIYHLMRLHHTQEMQLSKHCSCYDLHTCGCAEFLTGSCRP